MINQAVDHLTEDALYWVLGDPQIWSRVVLYSPPLPHSPLTALQLIPGDYPYLYDVHREDYPEAGGRIPPVLLYVPERGEEPEARIPYRRRDAIPPPAEHVDGQVG